MDKLVAVRRIGVSILVAGSALFASSAAHADPHNNSFRATGHMPAMRTTHVASWNAGFRGMSAPHAVVFHVRDIRGGTMTMKAGATSGGGRAMPTTSGGTHADSR